MPNLFKQNVHGSKDRLTNAKDMRSLPCERQSSGNGMIGASALAAINACRSSESCESKLTIEIGIFLITLVVILFVYIIYDIYNHK
jgi:hypothetical protein